jgi:post-segregation antitoxin (ccd killing protein)
MANYFSAKKPKKVLKNLLIDEEDIIEAKKLGVKNLSDFVRYAIKNEIRNIKLDGLKGKYKKNEEVEES